MKIRKRYDRICCDRYWHWNSKEKLATIFDNFQQASSGTSRIYGGTGLGLAIVKQLVEPQGGSINVVSKVGKGTTFSFRLNFNCRSRIRNRNT
jgi:signal transduction histidine kinase